MRSVERGLDILRRRAGDLRIDLARDRRDHIEILALRGRHEFTADKIIIAGSIIDLGTGLAGGCVDSHLGLLVEMVIARASRSAKGASPVTIDAGSRRRFEAAVPASKTCAIGAIPPSAPISNIARRRGRLKGASEVF